MENDEDLINLGFQGGFDNPDAKLDPVDNSSKGPGVSGFQVKTQPGRVKQKQDPPAGGSDKGKQKQPKSSKGSSMEDQEASTNECKHEVCPEALRLAKVVELVLSRVDVLEAEVQTLKSKLSAHEGGSKPLSDAAKVQSDLAKRRAEEGLKASSTMSEKLRQSWVSYYDANLRPPLSAKEATDFIRACGWPAELLADASTASLNDVACGVARLYYCQGLAAGIDERHHYISWNAVTKEECLDYITWAIPCVGQWLESLSSVAREELLTSYKANQLDIVLAKQPSANMRSVLVPVKKRKSKALAKVPTHNDLEENSSIPNVVNPPVPEEQPQPATKRSKPSTEESGPSRTDRYKHDRRIVSKSWRTKRISEGHWSTSDEDKLRRYLKDTLYNQGVANHAEYEEEVRLNVMQVITACVEARDEAAYQAQVAKAAKTPKPVSHTAPSTSSLQPPNNSMVASFRSLDIRPRTPSTPHNTRGGGSSRGRGGSNHHSYSSRGSRGGNRYRGRGKALFKANGGKSSR